MSDPTQYHAAVGKIMYAAVGTRPDLAFAASYISRAMANPTNIQFKVVKRVLRYLKGTPKLGVLYQELKLKRKTDTMVTS